MTRNTALAGAARRVRSLVERLPESSRPDLVVAWGDLLDRIEGRDDPRALREIETWVEEQERRLLGALTHAPLDDQEAA